MRRHVLLLATTTTLAALAGACGDTDDAASGCSPIVSEVSVGAQDDLTFDAESYEANPGCVEFTYTNEGAIAHTLLIRDRSGFTLSVGDTDTGTVDLSADSYELYCDIAGHEAAGMVADLAVQ